MFKLELVNRLCEDFHSFFRKRNRMPRCPRLLFSLLMAVAGYGLSVSAHASAPVQFNLQNERWHQLTVPASTSIPTLNTIVGNSMTGLTYQVDWLVYRYDSDSGYSIVEQDDPLAVGSALWIIQASGQDITLSIDVSGEYFHLDAPDNCRMSGGCYNWSLESDPSAVIWNLIGSPFAASSVFEDLALLDPFVDSSVISDNGQFIVFIYDPTIENYVSVDQLPVAPPLQGFWAGFLANTDSDTLQLSLSEPFSTSASNDGFIDTNGLSHSLAYLDLNDEMSLHLAGSRDGDGLPIAIQTAYFGDSDNFEDSRFNMEMSINSLPTGYASISHPQLGRLWSSSTIEGDRRISWSPPGSGEAVNTFLDRVDPEDFGFFFSAEQHSPEQPVFDSVDSAREDKYSSSDINSLTRNTSGRSGTVQVACDNGTLLDNRTSDLTIVARPLVNPSQSGDFPEYLRATHLENGVYEYSLPAVGAAGPLSSNTDRIAALSDSSCAFINILKLREKKVTGSIAAGLSNLNPAKLRNKAMVAALIKAGDVFCKVKDVPQANLQVLARERNSYSLTATGSRAGNVPFMGQASTTWVANAQDIGQIPQETVTLAAGACPVTNVLLTDVACDVVSSQVSTNSNGNIIIDETVLFQYEGTAVNDYDLYGSKSVRNWPKIRGSTSSMSKVITDEPFVLNECDAWSGTYINGNVTPENLSCSQLSIDDSETGWSGEYLTTRSRTSNSVHSPLNIAVRIGGGGVLLAKEYEIPGCPGRYTCNDAFNSCN